MKHLFFIQIFIFGFTFCFSQTIDEINGFKSGIFGMEEEKLGNKKIVYESEVSKTYKNENEDLKLGDYSFFQIDYAFYEGKLWKISAHCSESKNIQGILNMLLKSYGDYKTEKISGKKDVIKYLWEGNKISISMITFDDFTAAKLVFIDKIPEKKLSEHFKNLPEKQHGFHELIERK